MSFKELLVFKNNKDANKKVASEFHLRQNRRNEEYLEKDRRHSITERFLNRSYDI